MRKWLQSGCPLILFAWAMLCLQVNFLTNITFDVCCIAGALLVLIGYMTYELKPKKRK